MVPEASAQVRAFTADSLRVGLQNNGGASFPPKLTYRVVLQNTEFHPEVSPPPVLETSHQTCDAQGNPGFYPKESSENKGPRGLLSFLWAKGHGRPSQPYVTAQPWCSGKHHGCFCEGALTLAGHFREAPTLKESSSLGSHWTSQL